MLEKHMLTFRNYEELHDYLSDMVNFSGREGEFDLVGISMLTLALVENLRNHGVDSDIETICECMTPDQANFILKLADGVRSRGAGNSD